MKIFSGNIVGYLKNCISLIQQNTRTMKTMKDFKGSHGEFKREGTVVYSLIQDGYRKGEPLMVNDLYIYVYSSTTEKAEANARLFANSKRVLEAAIEMVQHMNKEMAAHMEDGFFEKEHELKVNLEQAINDSL